MPTTRIGLISDTHGWLDPRVQEHFSGCDEIWHAGDIGGLHVSDELASWKPLRAVWGNIDDAKVRQAFLEDQRFTHNGLDCWITHIGGKPPRYNNSVLPRLKASPPGLFICGHSHICGVQFDEKLGMMFMNPGAAGRHGWHQVRTLLRFSITDGVLKDLQVIELGRRGAMG